MKKRTILILAMLFAVCMVFAGCGSDQSDESGSDSGTATQEETSQDDSSSDDSSSGGALYSKDGVDVVSVAVELVGETFNFQVVFANNNDKAVSFDTSKFEIKKGDNSIPVNASTADLEANQSYNQYAFTLSDTGDLALGDEVEILYDGKLLDKVTVEEF